MKTWLYTILVLLFPHWLQGETPKHQPGNTPVSPSSQVLNAQEFTKYFPPVSDFFDSLLPSQRFNGGILVAKDGEIIYEKYSGFQDLRKKDSLHAESSLHIASTSKTFTGMAILRLVQEGKLKTG